MTYRAHMAAVERPWLALAEAGHGPFLSFLAQTGVYTSEMIHHHGASLSKQQTADLLICHGTQQDLSLSTV